MRIDSHAASRISRLPNRAAYHFSVGEFAASQTVTSRELLNEPYGKIVYNPEQRVFGPDSDYSASQMARWVAELGRLSP
jgi:hypothetical protein